jgi:hypothetical protein
MYDKLYEGIKREGEADAVHLASAAPMEYQSIIAVLLLLHLTVRFISIYAAVFVLAAAIILFKGRVLSFGVVRENDDRFQTLLYYTVLTLSLTIILAGWPLWV